MPYYAWGPDRESQGAESDLRAAGPCFPGLAFDGAAGVGGRGEGDQQGWAIEK